MQGVIVLVKVCSTFNWSYNFSESRNKSNLFILIFEFIITFILTKFILLKVMHLIFYFYRKLFLPLKSAVCIYKIYFLLQSCLKLSFVYFFYFFHSFLGFHESCWLIFFSDKLQFMPLKDYFMYYKKYVLKKLILEKFS